ncbi:glycine betaine ABC transporter substrate-binding protein [Limosilactobacillus sp.]|uniref:glycine betaine ABC transporter substrate-binding protein n=1 Tax=Limosilactobacillus sp. TaxID=2773925 RepID=UPI003F09FF64
MNFKKIIKPVVIAMVTIIGLGTVVPAAHAASSKPIIVGSKALPESKTVSEIYALALENAGYKVTRKQNIANSVVYKAVKSGQIDVYPDYTGTIVEAYNHKNGHGKTEAQMAAMAKKEAAKDNLTTFNYAPGDDRQGVGIRTSVAKKYHIKNLSDLQKNSSKIRFASQGEFEKRADALPGMNKTYGKFHFKSIKDYDTSLLYKIMSQGKADAAPVSTTDGQLATSKFTLVKDNKNLWSPYNLVPVANNKAVKAYPKMEKTLNKVDAKLITKQLVQLNKKVSVDGQNYKTVAKNWYNHNMK